MSLFALTDGAFTRNFNFPAKEQIKREVKKYIAFP
jgi:hypothetical protein